MKHRRKILSPPKEGNVPKEVVRRAVKAAADEREGERKSNIAKALDELLEREDLSTAVLVYVRSDGSPGIVSRSDSPVDSAHLLMAAANILHSH